MIYEVSVVVEGRVTVVVETDSFEKAKDIAFNEVCEIDFGKLEDIINREVVNAEDEDGNFVDYL